MMVVMVFFAAGCAVQTTLGAGVGYTSAQLSAHTVCAATIATGPMRGIGQAVQSGCRMAASEAQIVAPDGPKADRLSSPDVEAAIPGAPTLRAASNVDLVRAAVTRGKRRRSAGIGGPGIWLRDAERPHAARGRHWPWPKAGRIATRSTSDGIR